VIAATPWTVFVAAAVTCVATGLGALPFWFRREFSRWWLGVANAAAAGMMFAASQSVVIEGLHYSPTRAIVGVLLGLGFIVITQDALKGRDRLALGELEGVDARKALLIIGVLTLHSIAEGIGVGVSFGGGEPLGTFVTAAVAVHNVPEGLAIALVLVPRGTSPLRASLWGMFSSLPQPLLALPAFLFVESFRGVLPLGLGFAAGAMIWLSAAELLPDALADAPPRTVGIVVTLAMATMLFLQGVVLR
jgi:zinc transporter ZupT